MEIGELRKKLEALEPPYCADCHYNPCRYGKENKAFCQFDIDQLLKLLSDYCEKCTWKMIGKSYLQSDCEEVKE